MSLVQYIDVEELEVRNPLVLLSTEAIDNTFTDNRDIGFVGQYWDTGAAALRYTGLFRDASDAATYKLFTGLTTLPTVNTGVVADVSALLANLDVKDLDASGNVTVAGNLTVSGTTTTVNVETLTVEDNIIIANSGPANQKEDGGFVVCRPLAAVILDTPKIASLVIDDVTTGGAVTTTAINLRAGAHTTASANVDYFKGWAIKVTGTGAGSSFITASTATNPVRVTLSTALGAAPVISDTYELYNKKYTGTIWDESTNQISMYGFPREDTEAVISTTGGTSGNLADYIDLHVNNLTVDGTSSITIAYDNILAINTAGTSADAGFVSLRNIADIVLDTPLESGTASAAGSTTTLVLQASNGHGTTLDYYKGWAVKLAVTSTESVFVLSSTAANPPVLTLDTTVTSTTTSTTYKLFNQRYVGLIYDESKDYFQLVGFPREASETVIDVASPVNGNIPSLIELNTAGSDDNIIPANVNQTYNDGGFVSKRKAADVAGDTPKELTVIVGTGTHTNITFDGDGATQLVGTVDDYYNGWVIKFTSGTNNNLVRTVVDYVGATKTITLDSAVTATIVAADTFNMYNKVYVGYIYDASTDKLTAYGFPREVGEDNIDLAGDSGDGNLADYMPIQTAAITSSSSITAGTTMTASGNITSTTGNIDATAGSVSAGTTMTANGNITSTTGNIAATAGSVSAGTTVTAGTGVTATTGNITASSGNVSASGTVTSGTTMTAGTGLTVTTGNLAVSSGNATISGDLTVSGFYKSPMKVDDNILAINTGPTNQLEDGGFAVCRTLTGVVADTPKEASLVMDVIGTSTTVFTLRTGEHAAAQIAANYYKGWAVKVAGTGSGNAWIIASTAANPVVVTLDTATPLSGTPAIGSTYELFNKRYASLIYDESTDKYTFYGHPREDAEATISTVSAAGNVADYLDLSVNNITAAGSITSPSATMTQVTATTFTAADIKDHDIIYLNPTGGNTTYTLPALSAVAMSLDQADFTLFVNIHATNKATIAGSGGNLIEGNSSMVLGRQWQKFTLVASNTTTISNVWLIE